MAEAKATKSSKPAAAVPAFEMPAFEMPKIEMPKFEMPKFELPKFDGAAIEMPAAFRDMAEKGLEQAKVSYEKMKTAAEEATDVLEATYSTVTKGSADLGLKALDAARANTNASFDFMRDLMAAKSLSEVVELSTAHTRKQVDAYVAQVKDMSGAVQKFGTDVAAPAKASFDKLVKTAA
jgi:phasin